MKKFLSIIAAMGLAATASTAVVACGTKEVSKDDQKPSKTPNLDKLKAEITNAKKIKQGKKSDEAFKALTDAIAKAEAVKDEDKAEAALTELKAAEKTFNDSADVETPAKTPNLDKLKAEITNAKKIKQGKKSDEAFKALTDAIAKAEAVKDEDKAEAALTELKAAEKTFNDSADVETPAKTPNLDKLKAEITNAKKIKQGKKSDEAFKALTDAIAKAEAVKDEDKAEAALTELKAAEKTFNDSADVETPAKTPNLDKLKAEITNAKNIKQGLKSKEEFNKLQDAIKAAEAVTDETKAADALTTLKAAEEAFNNSADQEGGEDQGTEGEGNDNTNTSEDGQDDQTTDPEAPKENA